jgi:hypothetical protein
MSPYNGGRTCCRRGPRPAKTKTIDCARTIFNDFGAQLQDRIAFKNESLKKQAQSPSSTLTIRAIHFKRWRNPSLNTQRHDNQSVLGRQLTILNSIIVSPTYSLVDKSVEVLGIAAGRCSAVSPGVICSATIVSSTNGGSCHKVLPDPHIFLLQTFYCA